MNLLKTWNGNALKAGEEISYVGISNGEPVFEAVNPCFSYMKHQKVLSLYMTQIHVVVNSG